MAEYIPSTADWVREQVEVYDSSGGTQGTTLRDTGLPVIIVTNRGNQTGAIRKTPLMRVRDGDNYVLVGSKGGAPKNPVWVYNLRADGRIEIRDETEVYQMQVREVPDDAERARLWDVAVEAFPALRGVSAPHVPQDSRIRRGTDVGSPTPHSDGDSQADADKPCYGNVYRDCCRHPKRIRAIEVQCELYWPSTSVIPYSIPYC